MADGSKIEWTDATWNPITGCSVVSPGCTHCYAMKLAGTRLRNHRSREGLTIETKAGPVWNGKLRFNDEWLDQPLRWRSARDIFVCAHSDLFHPAVPDTWLDRVFDVMEDNRCRHHRFQVLTKRPGRMRDYLRSRWSLGSSVNHFYGLPAHAECFQPFSQIWLGTTVENQRAADTRLPALRDTPTFKRFVSFEPLLGPVTVDLTGIDWAIVGGENGPRAMHPDWARSLRDQCRAAGVAFFFKQWGSWAPLDGARPAAIDAPGMVAWPSGQVGLRVPPAQRGGEGVAMFRGAKAVTGRLLDGVEHNGVPA